MFVQVVKGKVRDRALLEEREALWRSELRPYAKGFLGSTSGVTADGTFILVARFESAECARQNSERPEQAAWFEETVKAFDGAPTFRDSDDVQLQFGGGSDEATFVQVMEGCTTNEADLRAVMASMQSELEQMRPQDLLGTTIAWHGDGSFTQAVYFKSLDEARKNEAAMADDRRAEAITDLIDGPMTFFDLKEPHFA
jgi:hypothetical protein